MKLRSLFYATLCGLLVTGTFTSCSDDEEVNDSWKEGSKIDLPRYRGFVLNEGTYEKNNTTISYFDAAADTTTTKLNDLFTIQNGMPLGDTGQDIIAEDGYLYVSVYGSSYVAKLNGSGVLQSKYNCNSEIGQPRYLVEEDGYLYVTTYGGYIVKLKASDLSYVDKVAVGHTPEGIAEEDGKLYCVNGNSVDGTASDNRLAIVDIATFKVDKYVEVANNPQKVVCDDGFVFIQAYGDDWVNTPIQAYDIKTGKLTDLGYGSRIAVEDDALYVIYSKTDWNTYQTVNTFFTYNVHTLQKTDITNKVTSEVPELGSATIYSFSVNPYDDSFYIGTTLYASGYGTIYHFGKDWSYKTKFTSWGQNPNNVVFLK